MLQTGRVQPIQIMVHTLRPVSYTHLDVYKRQVNDYPGDHDKMDPYISPLFGDFRGFPPMLIQAGSIETVSYTHLDVYKRQKKEC